VLCGGIFFSAVRSSSLRCTLAEDADAPARLRRPLLGGDLEIGELLGRELAPRDARGKSDDVDGPEPDLAVLRAGRHPPRVRRDLDVDETRLADGIARRERARSRIPELRGPVVGCRGDPRLIGRDRDRADGGMMAAELESWLGRGEVPNDRALVGGRGDEERPSGSDDEIEDSALVAVEGANLAVPAQVSDANPMVRRRGDEVASVRRERERADLALVIRPAPDLDSRRRVSETRHTSSRPARDERAVRVERDDIDSSLLLASPKLRAVGETPNPNGAVLRCRGDPSAAWIDGKPQNDSLVTCERRDPLAGSHVRN